MGDQEICVLQVSNISPIASREQVYTLFSYIGRISELVLYPSEGNSTEKFAFVKFDRESCVELGQHLTNTVFIDRAVVCVPAPSNRIPDEETALRNGPTLPGQRHLPPNVTNSVQNVDGMELLCTTDPNLASMGLPAYPPLPADTEAGKVEEIRRTVYLGNLDKSVDGEHLMAFLSACIGEVMYLRMTQENAALPCNYAYVEFSKQSSVPAALMNNGIEYNGRPLRIQHSRVAIIKPKQKTVDQALEEVEDAIRSKEGKEKPADLGPGYSPSSRRSGSRRRSPSPRRSRDRSPRRERSRDKERERERSPRRRRSRSRDRDSRRDRDRDARRDSDRDRHDKDSGRDRDDKKSAKKSKEKEREREKDREKDREKERERQKDKERSEKSHKERKRSRSKSPKKGKKKRSSRSPTPKKSKKERKKTATPPLLEEEAELRRRLLEKRPPPADGNK